MTLRPKPVWMSVRYPSSRTRSLCPACRCTFGSAAGWSYPWTISRSLNSHSVIRTTIMSTNASRPLGRDEDALVARHNELLARHARIRVMNRWGPWTEYAIKLKKSEAEALLGTGEATSGQWRVVVALDEEGTTVGLHRFDTEDREWHDAFEFGATDAEEEVVRRIQRWLDENWRGIEEMLEIDREMLRLVPSR